MRLQASLLAGRNLFAEVGAAFLREPPPLSEMRAAWRHFAAVYVVPMFTCRGYICDTLVPRALDLVGPVTEDGGCRWLLCDPVGCHHGVTDLLAARIRAMAADFRLILEATSVLLAAHGSRLEPDSFRRTQEVAAGLRVWNERLDVQTGFLEQVPRIHEGLTACRHRDVLVVPFMIGAGAHGTVDVPVSLGLDPADPRLAAASARGHAGPFAVGSKVIHLARAFGNEPEVADLVLDLLTDFRRRFSA